MVVRNQERFREMMAQAEVSPEAMRGRLDRIETFAHPCCASLGAGERRRAAEYLTGLLSHLEHKTAEGIAYLLDQDRQPMQRFIGQADWDHGPSLAILAAQVGERLGEPDGVIVFDPLGLRQGGGQVGRRGPAVVRPARQGRGLSGRCLHGICLADRTRPGQPPALPPGGVDEGPGPMPRGGHPTRGPGSDPP
jgi:hypothetical protein